MSKIYLVLVLIFTMSFAGNTQPWMKNIPQAKLRTGELTFYEIQDAFNQFCKDNNVVNGYIEDRGEKLKVPGWKLFKRWEYYWQDRVDVQTGAFPTTTAIDEFLKIQKAGNHLKSTTGTWTNLGTSSSTGGYAGIGRLNCVAFHSGSSNTLYVGSPSGGAWKTTDGGTNWTVLTDGNTVLGVSDIVVIPTAGSDIVYIGTGDRDVGSGWSMGGGQTNDNNGVGVLKSTDGGSTWSSTGLSWTASQKYKVNRLLVDPGNTDTLYAATSLGIYKTTNAGTSWTLMKSGSYIDIEMNPSNSSILYGCTEDYWGAPVIDKTINGGTSWTTVKTYATTDARVDLAVTAANSTYVYAVVANRSGTLTEISRSTDTGASFSQVFSGSTSGNYLLGYYCDGTDAAGLGGQGRYDLCIAVDPTSASTVFVGGVNTWKSTDSGANWTNNNMWTSNGTFNSCGSPVAHADKHFLAFQNGTSTLFECNDGGIYKTSDGGSTWTDLTNGLVISQIYRIGTGQATSTEIIAGLQDNGTKNYSSGTWSDVLGGDGMECFIDPTDNNTQYGEIQLGEIRRTTNHWAAATDITTGLTGNAHWITPFVIDPNTNTTIYVGYQDLWKSTNQGTAWTKISTWTAGDELRCISVAPSNSNYICASSYKNTANCILYRTTDGGTNWTVITGTLPVSTSNITYVATKATDPNTIWVTMGGYNSDGVYETTDGGTTWTNISTGLPSLPIMCIVQNKQTTAQNELYVGTDVGVYMKYGTSSWTSFSSGLPNVFVPELDIYYDNTTNSNSRLRAATFGRGLWESDLRSAPVADFAASDQTPATSLTPVTFTDQSTNGPSSWSWSFTPSTVTYTSGTSSTSQNPVVLFTNKGAYDVALTATNTIGSDVETKTSHIHMGTAGLWTGNASTAWNTTGNWDNAMVPDASTSITINDGVPNWPTYTGDFTVGTQSGNLSLTGSSVFNITGDLDVPSGSSITCTSSPTIKIGGDYSNTGTLTPASGVVELNGGADASLNGNISGSSSLSTVYTGLAVWTANYFDITSAAGKEITVSSFDIHCNTTGSVTVEVWYATSTYVGQESTPGSWTQLGTTQTVTGLGYGNPVTINPGATIAIPAGTTYGFFLSCYSGGTAYLIFTGSSNSYNNVNVFYAKSGRKL
jgi:PKD repeat protein